MVSVGTQSVMGKDIKLVCASCEAKLTPESAQFDKFKRQKVCVGMLGGTHAVKGILEWVDVYTVGVRTQGGSEPVVIYKGPGVIISLDGDS